MPISSMEILFLTTNKLIIRMKKILLILIVISTVLNLNAQDTVLDDLPTNADGTKIRYVKKLEGGGTPDVAFDRIECLFKNTELLMKNYDAHGSEFSDSVKVIRIKIKENIEIESVLSK